MNPRFSPFPILTTERLVLRKLDNTDKNEIFLIRSDQGMNRYIERPRLKTMHDAEEFIQKIHNNLDDELSIYWAIGLTGHPQLIGTICLWNFSDNHTAAEIGYELIPEYQGKGFLSEALRSVLDYGFNNISLKRIDAYTHKENKPSINLLQKNGFTPELNKTDPDQPFNIIFSLTQVNFKNT